MTEEKQLTITGPTQEISKPAVLMIEGPDGRKAPVLLVPERDGMAVHDGLAFIDDYQPPKAPHRTKGTAKIEALGSFIEHVNRFKRPETALFIRRSGPVVEAVYDYHALTAPAFAEHRASFAFASTPAWKAWQSASGKEMGADAFANFLEDRSADMIDPAILPESARSAIFEAEAATGSKAVHPDAIRTLARGLEYHRSATNVEMRNLRTGECKIAFEEKLTGKDGETLDIPGLFAIAVEMFDARLPGVNGEPPKASRYVIPVRLRVRAPKSESEGLKWTLLLHNVDRCVDLALSEAADRVAKDTGCPVFWGAPES